MINTAFQRKIGSIRWLLWMLALVIMLSACGVSFAEDTYTSSIKFKDGSPTAYFGGDTVNIYSNLRKEGAAQLPAGSYTVITLPKDVFVKPEEKDLYTAFPQYQNMEVKETADSYQLCIYYNTLGGGFDVSVPIKLKLLGGKVVNKRDYTISQSFCNAEGEVLAGPSSITLTGKAKLLIGSYSGGGLYNLKDEVDKNDVVKPGTCKQFGFPFAFTNANYDHADPRPIRVYATLPEGSKMGPKNSDWIYDDATKTYWHDFTFEEYKKGVHIDVDLGGLNLSGTSSSNWKKVSTSFKIRPLENGVPQEDIKEGASQYNNYYVDKKAKPSYDFGWGSKMIDQNGKVTEGTTVPTDDRWTKYYPIPYDQDRLGDIYALYWRKPLTYFGIYNQHGEEGKLTIKAAEYKMSGVNYPGKIRLMLTDKGKKNAAFLREKLKGVKVYGIKANREKTLLTDNVPIADANDNSVWLNVPGGESYQSVRFEYPNGGLVIDIKEVEIFKEAFEEQIACHFTQEIYNRLKQMLDNGQEPTIKYTKDGGIGNEYAYLYKKLVDDTELTDFNGYSSGAISTPVTMEHDGLYTYNKIRLSESYSNDQSGIQYIAGNELHTYTGTFHWFTGKKDTKEKTENLTFYYLVPNGLEPVQSIEGRNNVQPFTVKRGYRPGYNLVIVPYRSDPHSYYGPNYYNRSVSNYMTFRITARLGDGAFDIRACAIIDNNKLDYTAEDGHKGVQQFDKPTTPWDGITKKGANHPVSLDRFTDLGKTTFKVSMPKILFGLKDVKLATQSEGEFAPALTEGATIGDAIDYRMSLINNSDNAINTLSIIDVLPYQNDTMIVPDKTGKYGNRGSAFTTVPTGPVVGADRFNIYYSTDAVKGTLQENLAATWVSSVSDWSKVTMIKAVLKPGEVIQKGETLSFDFPCVIEDTLRIQEGESAKNTLALSTDGEVNFLESYWSTVEVHYAKRDVRVKKVDKSHPEKVLPGAKFNLYLKGVEGARDTWIASDVVTDENGMLFFPNLLERHTYYLSETAPPLGYARGQQFFFTVREQKPGDEGAQLVVVENDIRRIDIFGKKTWNDYYDQDGLRPETVTIMVKNGDQVVRSITLDGTPDNNGETAAWTYEFKGLPKYENLQMINYTVEEETVPGYSLKMTQPTMFDYQDEYRVNLENTHRPVSFSKTIRKVWDDNNNQDNLRTDVTLQLVATVDGTEVPWDTLKNASYTRYSMARSNIFKLTERKDQSYTFDYLPAKYKGKTVVYTVQETTVPDGYTVRYDQDNLTVTNVHAPATTSKTVSKVWKDNHNQDGLRTDVTLKLVAQVDRAKIEWSTLKAASASGNEMDDDGLVTLTGKKDESYTFEHLPEKYQGKAVVYTVEEQAVPTGYAVRYDQNTLTVTNSYTPKTTKRTVRKAWVDHNNQDGLRTSVTLKLVATVDGTEVDWATLKNASASKNYMDGDGLITLTGKKDESHSFENLPAKYQGKAVVYTILEPTVPAGYAVTYNQATLTATNTHVPVTLTKTVSKAWVDNNNQDGLRTDVTLKLVATANGTQVEWRTLKNASASGAQMDGDGLITLTGKKDESYAFENLPEKYQGKTVVYTVLEPTVPTGYAVTYDQATLTVTNSHTPATLSKTVSKAWVDNNDQDGLRTDVTLKLVATANGAEVDWATLKAASASGDQMDDDGLITLTGKKDESHTFENLPEKYQGQTVVYTVKEPTVPTGYAVTYNQANLTATNTHTPATFSKTVSKVWDDHNDQDGLRTDVTFKLVATADGAEVDWATLKAASLSGDQMDDDGLVTLTGKKNESHTFTNLPAKYLGKAVVYTVLETTVPTGYAVTYDQATLTVTNSHTPATLSRTVSKAWADNNDQDGLRTDVTLKLVATVDGAEVKWSTLKAASLSGEQMDDDGLITLTGKKDESYTFENLPEKYQGQTVVYTVKETTVPTGYAVTYDQATLKVTNTHKPATLSKTISKAWADNNDQDGLRTDVTLKLVATAEGAEVKWSTLKAASLSGDQMDDDGLITLTGKKDESHTFSNLPEKYQGKAVVYTVKETTVPVSYQESYDQNTLTVTNSYTPKTTKVSVSKKWVDEDDRYGLRADATLKLVPTVDEKEIPWATLKNASASGDQMDEDGLITLTGKVDESFTFLNLPVNYQGKKIVYTVKETPVPAGYAPTASGTQEDGLVITNTLKDIRPAVLKFHAEKTLEGRVLTGGMFSFDLKDTTKKKPELLETVTNAEDGSVDFAPITLEEVGTYSYRMTERKGHVRGFTYDKAVYDMTVELTVKTDGNGDPYFAGTPEVKKNGQPYTGAAIFANSYEEPPATIRVPIEVYKRLRGGKLKADAFAFTLYDASGKELQTVRNKEDGSVVFDARRISRPGTFVYTVKEVNEGVKSIAYDQSVYRAEIKVWQSGRELYHRIDWEKDGVPFDGEVAFRNRVKIPGTGDSALVLPMVLTSLSVALLGLSVWQKKRRKQNG